MPREEEQVEESVPEEMLAEFPSSIGNYLVRKEEEEGLKEMEPLAKSRSCKDSLVP